MEKKVDAGYPWGTVTIPVGFSLQKVPASCEGGCEEGEPGHFCCAPGWRTSIERRGWVVLDVQLLYEGWVALVAVPPPGFMLVPGGEDEKTVPLPWGTIHLSGWGLLIPQPSTQEALRKIITEGFWGPLSDTQRTPDVIKDVRNLLKYINLNYEEGEALLRFFSLRGRIEWIGWPGVEKFLKRLFYHLDK